MDKEKELELKAKYPLVFHNMHNTSSRGCMMFGLEIGTGWLGIIEEAAAKLEPLIAQWIKDNPDEIEDWGFPTSSQVKEKFSTLRWYFSGGTDEIYQILGEAERKSQTTCEECGQPGKLRGNSWVYTACDKCEEKHERKRNSQANGK
jgi:hypothetical protein